MLEGCASGTLGKDAEFRTTKNGNPMLVFSIAANVGQDATQWVSILAFGSLADEWNDNLSKGSKVYVEGQLRLETFKGRDGEERQSLKILADLIRPMGARHRAETRKANRKRSDGPGAAPTPGNGHDGPPAAGHADLNDALPW